MKRDIVFGLYVTMLVLANIVAIKTLTVVGLTFTAGVFPIAAAYLLSDIHVENEGKEAGHTLVWVGVVALIATIIILQIFARVGQETALSTIANQSLSIFLASITSILVGQHFDVEAFAWLKARYNIRAVRNITSTTFSQLIDTSLFTICAFAVYPAFIGGIKLPVSVILTIIGVEWVVKVSIAIMDTPAFYYATDSN